MLAVARFIAELQIALYHANIVLRQMKRSDVSIIPFYHTDYTGTGLTVL